MCQQIFVYHACGHQQIVEQACEQAKGFDVALWAKHLCMFYSKKGMQSPTLCGKGQFYCGQMGKDGHFLDKAYEVKAASDARLQSLDAQLLRLQGQARHFTAIADARGIPQELRKQHHAFGLISRHFGALIRERIPLTADNQRAKHIIAEGLKWFQVRKQLLQRNGPDVPLPPLVINPLSIVPLEVQAPLTQNPLAGAMITHPNPIAITQQAIDVSQGAQTPAQTATHMPSSEGSNIEVAHVRHDRVDPKALEKALSNPNPQNGQRIHMHTPLQYNSPFQETPGRRSIEQDTATKKTRRSKRKSPEKAEADTIESEARPKRKCVKRITYAESQTSDITDNRDSSPDKYQDSPEKTISVVSGSPEPPPRRGSKTQQRKTRKSGTDSVEASEAPRETLATKIGDWRKRRGDDGDVSSDKSVSTPQASGRRKRSAAAAELQADQRRAKRPMVSSRASAAATQLQHAQSGTPKITPLASTFDGAVLNYGGGKKNTFNSYLQQGQSLPPVQLWSVQRGTEPSARARTTRAGLFSLPESDPALRARRDSVFNHEDSNGIQPAGRLADTQSMGFGTAQNSTNGPSATQQPIPNFGASNYGSSSAPFMSSDFQLPTSNNKADSVMGFGENIQFGDFDFNKQFSYNSMRGSLEDPFSMSPPKTNGTELPTTDPKKRALPASSPIPPAQDMELSMPEQTHGFDTSGMQMRDGSGLNHCITLSSPAKISTQLADMPVTDGTPKVIKQLNAPETRPAPAMTPTDIFGGATESSALPELDWAVQQPYSAASGVGVQRGDQGAAADLPSNAANGIGVQGGEDEPVSGQDGGAMTEDVAGGEPGADFDWDAIQQWFAFDEA